MKGKDYKKTTAKLLLSAMLVIGVFIQKSYAQDAVGYIGLTAAPLYTGLSSDRHSLGSVFGFSGGITPEVKIGEGFGIELDLLVSEKGGTRKYTDSTSNFYNGNYYYNYNLTYNFMYAQADLLFKWYIHIDHNPVIPYEAPGHHSFIFFEAGPYFADMLSYSSSGTVQQYGIDINFGRNDTISIDGASKKSYSSSPTLNSSTISTTDIGATVGFGVIFPVSHRGLLSFEARYSKGFASIDNGEFGYYQERYSTAVPSYWLIPANVTTFDVGLYVTFKYRVLGGGE